MVQRGNHSVTKGKRIINLEFKGRVGEDLLSGNSGAAQTCRKYNSCASFLYHWKESVAEQA